MLWKFWQKNKEASALKEEKPKDLPSRLGKYLVVDLQYDPDWVWSLKVTSRKRKNYHYVYEFRVFDPVSAKMNAREIRQFSSLDDYPEMIFFDGWYNKDNWEMDVKDRYARLNKGKIA